MRYVNRIFHQMDPTIGVDYMVKHVNNMDKSIRITIWDASGYKLYQHIIQQYYKLADLIVLVYDVTDVTSYENLDSWLEELKNYNPTCNIILVANKVDDKYKRVISTEMGISYAKKNDIPYIETSARMDQNIDLIFTEHINRICGPKTQEPNDINLDGRLCESFYHIIKIFDRWL